MNSVHIKGYFLSENELTCAERATFNLMVDSKSYENESDFESACVTALRLITNKRK